jgi:peptidoglycan/LPS O-acetylase OafA/YrhL
MHAEHAIVLSHKIVIARPMRWTDQVFRYCERGSDPGLWAEPVNALSNAAFLIVALVAAVRMTRLPNPRKAPDPLAAVLVHPLIALVALIGAGSFLFHLTATRWARLADVLPIGAFMLLYLAFALRCLVGLPVPKVMLGIAVFVAAFLAVAAFCPPGGPACLNGTIGYAPAFAALLAIGAVLHRQSHPAAGRLLVAAAVLLLSMVMRTVDLDHCSAFNLESRPLGSHFLWHLLNALVLHLLLSVAVDETRRLRPGTR